MHIIIFGIQFDGDVTFLTVLMSEGFSQENHSCVDVPFGQD
jgi:hypothetical protein